MEQKGLARNGSGTVQAIALGKGSGRTANGDIDTDGYSAIEFSADTTVTLKFTDGTADATVDVKENSRYGISSDVSKLSFTGKYNIC